MASPYNLMIAVNLGPLHAASTIKARCYNSAGTGTGSEISMTHVGNGNFRAFITDAQIAMSLQGYVIFYENGTPETPLSIVAINPETVKGFTIYDPPTKAEMDAAHALLATPAQVATELGTYDAPTKAELDSSLAALNDLSAAEVNAEVDTALTDYDAPTKAEMDSAHALLATAANLSTLDALVLALWRYRFNKTTVNRTTGVITVYADDTTTPLFTMDFSTDGTTFTKLAKADV